MDELQKINDLRAALDNLRQQSAALKKFFGELGKSLDAETFAFLDVLKDFGREFTSWTEELDTCLELWRELFDEPFPKNFAAMEKFLSDREKQILAESVFGRAEKFMSLTSTNSELADELIRHQKILKPLLRAKTDDAAVKPYADFVNVFEESDPVKKFSASVTLRQTFSDNLIGNGIFGDALTVTAQGTLPIDTPKEIPDDLPEPEPPPTSDGFAKILRDKGALLTDADLKPWEENFSVDPEPTRNIDAKHFKKDFDPKPEYFGSEKLDILGDAVFKSCFSRAELDPKRKLKPENLDNALKLLRDRGYLKRYTLGGHIEFYGVSKNFFDFMKADKFKTFRKVFPKISWPKDSRDSELLEDRLQIALPRGIFLRLKNVESDAENKLDDSKFFMESFFAGVEAADKFNLLVGCFWREPAEAEAFLHDLAAYVKIRGKVDRIIVAGLNLKHAVKMFDALEAALPEKFSADTARCTYALDENLIYRKDSAGDWKPVDETKPDDEPPTDEPPVKKTRRKTAVKPKPPVEPTTDDEPTVEQKVEPPAKKTRRKTAVKPKPPVEPTTDDESTVEQKVEPPAKRTRRKTAVKPKPPVEPTPDDESTVAPKIEEPPKVETPLPADPRAIVEEMLAAKKFYCATAYLKASSLSDASLAPLYRQLACAMNDPLSAPVYSSDKIISLIDASEPMSEIFLTAATLRTFFYNVAPFDYKMKNLHGTVKNFSPVDNNAPLAELISALMHFKDKVHNGADYYADYRNENRQQSENKIERLCTEAKTCLDRIENFNDKAFFPRFIMTKKILLGEGSELATYLEYTAENTFDADIAKTIKAYLTAKFIRDEAPLDVANLDTFKFNNVIELAWDEAGKQVARKKNNSLVGVHKNKLEKLLRRAIEILCERVNLFEETAALRDDAGAAEYQKIRAKLIDNAKAAQKILASENIAGNEVLIATLQEIVDRLEGNFKPDRQKFFYADFLRGTEILLDEDYLPILTFNTLDGTINTPDDTKENVAARYKDVAARIVAHARAELPTFEERIENIRQDVNKNGDFGTAQLIDAYLKEVGGESFIAKHKLNLQAAIDPAKNISSNNKKKFFGFLELAQSYGQFDAAPLNTKETILKLIDRCFEFTSKLNNFGVFFRVKTYWENKIRADAAKYAEQVEKSLQLAIEKYSREFTDKPEFESTVAHIREMIERQNYTVAQALINRLSEGKLYSDPQETGETHLQRFIDDFNLYYTPVHKMSVSFKNLVDENKHFAYAHTAKSSRGGKLLVDNWIPNGITAKGVDLVTARIQNLLTLLGFKVADVKRTGELKKDEISYKITLQRPRNGQSSNYSHPISAFGSNAEKNGFRVTCLFGNFTVDGLLARFKALGNADDTLVLWDYALDLPIRRILVRKIKAEANITKVFAVVDRVLMMYLVKNYDEPQMNKMLMSLTMPFAACQPYVFNPNVPIPPEIFIGREKEMSDVLDFNGVNLVYGGRQLGKTALLKMACASLDRNENNDRAVFVDVNKCDCAAAAVKICRVLREKNFFNETFEDTDDWAKLVEMIKARLASESDKIPHFLLALDEADDFIKSCRKENFAPILQLMDLQQNPPDDSRFKFVMAGLRDIVRFYREETLGNNNQFAKLPSRAVRPFDLDEANTLLREPLRCLGLYFPDTEAGDSLALMILETTNYFPGLIQLYCAKLIEALSNKDYAGYSDSSTDGDKIAPVYKISDSHVQSVLSEKTFNEEIKNKIQMTLRLGDDKFYFVIANLMAWRYHNDDLPEGYSAEDILSTAKGFGLEQLLPADVKQVEALLKELCALNILRENVSGKYLFVRQRFLNIIGTPEEIEAEIINDFGVI